MKKILLSFYLLLQIPGYAQTFSKKYSWIIGKWEMKVGDKSIFEEWELKNDSTFSGTSLSIDKNGSKKIFETMELRFQNGKTAYVPTVNGQNKNKPVIFEIEIYEQNKFKAENLLHDFPQAIYYELKSATELNARIEGTKNGKLRKEEWLFKK